MLFYGRASIRRPFYLHIAIRNTSINSNGYYMILTNLLPLVFLMLISSILTISLHMPFKGQERAIGSIVSIIQPLPSTTTPRLIVDKLRDTNDKIRDKAHGSYSESLHNLIYRIAREEDINPNLIWSIIKVESATGLMRYEPGTYINRAMADAHLSPEDRKAMSTSHGLMQVMGYNAASCGLHWRELYRPEDNLRCGLRLLKGWIRVSKGSTPRERLYNALAKYNGGYRPGPASYAHALKVLNGL